MTEEKKQVEQQNDAPKKVISHFLREKRNWVDARMMKPKPGQLVVMRLTNPTIIWAENETEIYPAEDIKIGHFLQDYNNPNSGKWAVAPPFPRYDYSELTSKEKLNDFTIVTHWAIPEEGEVDGWKTRFDQINLFKTLKLEVDEQHEEDVYRALLHGAYFMNKYAADDPEIQHLATILYDLQYVLDKHKGIELSDEEFEAMVVERTRQAQEESESDEESGDGEPEDKSE